LRGKRSESVSQGKGDWYSVTWVLSTLEGEALISHQSGLVRKKRHSGFLQHSESGGRG